MAITSRAIAMQNMAAGKGWLCPFATTAGASITTTSNAGDGFTFLQIQPNNIGTTLQSTLQSIPFPSGLPDEMFLQFCAVGSGTGSARGIQLARLYKFGTQNLSATGDQFTHDAATFPVLRTQFGAASQAVTLLPMIQLTTTLATTAPAVRLRTAAGGTGYVSQDGSNVVGANTLTYPSATAVNGTSYYLKLNSGDSGVRDVVACETTIASAASKTATIWGVEILTPLHMYSSLTPNVADSLMAGLSPVDLAPAVATSGTATSILAILCYHSNAADTWLGWIGGALNA